MTSKSSNRNRAYSDMVHFFKKKFVAQWNQQLPLEQCPAEAAQNDQELIFFGSFSPGLTWQRCKSQCGNPCTDVKYIFLTISCQLFQ
jgi:hypothetical protein